MVAKANCGIPVIQGEKVVYTGTPELMYDYTVMAMDAGAKIIGGCCGTSCDHLKYMRKAIDDHLAEEEVARPTRRRNHCQNRADEKRHLCRQRCPGTTRAQRRRRRG